MKWNKLNHVFCANNHTELLNSYARLPVTDKVVGDICEIYFASRDITNRERVFKLFFDMKNLSVIEIQKQPVLNYGETLGAFDDNGIAPCSILSIKDKKHLYYAGWQKQVNTPFSCAVGVAVSNDNGKTFKKIYKGPILDRDKKDFLFVAVNDVLYDNGIFKTWYLSCVEWKHRNNQKPLHYYHINYAESYDGLDWHKLKGENAITFKNELEYAISTPRVIKDGINDYKMWYSYRAQINIDTYRIGYAESKDGLNWKRKDELMSKFDVSNDGWDSEMICYPHIFDYNGERYMLYNGNGYGETGFGIAILQR